jgi:TatD DNase family protein
MIDTHCHLYTKEFDNDLKEIVSRAVEAGVTKFYLPAIDSSCTQRMMNLEDQFPRKCFSMAGLHPCSVKENFAEEINHVKEMLAKRKYYGIGETGLDFYWDTTFADQQYKALEMQIDLALEYNLPLILHTRNATQETIDVVKKYSGTKLSGIFHCFGGTITEANEIIETGFYLGIGGVLTYKNSGLAEVIAQVDMSHIVLETDAPYLAPAPFRGKRNESSYLKIIAEKLAVVKNISVDEVDKITTFNAEKIFGV